MSEMARPEGANGEYTWQPDSIVNLMLKDESNWRCIGIFARQVLSLKRSDESSVNGNSAEVLRLWLRPG